MRTLRREFVRDHAATQGHFPQHPIVPGAFVLDDVICAISDEFQLPRQSITVDGVKFPSPIIAGQTMTLNVEDPVARPEGRAVKFRGSVEGRQVISGSLLFAGD